jgi:Class III cytochrome C family
VVLSYLDCRTSLEEGRMKRRVVPMVMAVVVLFAAGIVLQAAQAPKVPGPVILKGAPMGGVRLDHKIHQEAGVKCDSCHHASNPIMPMKAANQKCSDCHTKAAKAPMKTRYQAAFHDPMAKTGTCVTCHTDAVKKGNKKAPTKCADCHKKENV